MNVLVAGGGPAGSRIAEKLANKGIPVTLVESLKKPNQNAFSSAALPISSINELNIPSSVISARWKCWQIYDPDGTKFEWHEGKDIGVVLDFPKLRQNLWKKAKSSGVEFLLGWKVQSVKEVKKIIHATLITPSGTAQVRKFDWIIDATGYKRTFLESRPSPSFSRGDQFLSGMGLEFLVQADSRSFSNWNEKITFFLGTKWIPHGYGWIFPMSDNQLKVGVCRLPPPSSDQLPSLKTLLDQLLAITDLDKLHVLDRHGGLIRSSLKRSEIHSFGRIVGVGDVISSANLLGGEGIRHAIRTAELLAPLLTKACLAKKLTSDIEQRLLWKYRKTIQNDMGWRWQVSNRLARRTWWGLSDKTADERIKKIIKGLSQSSSAVDLSALLFDYRFERYGIRLLPYIFGLR